MCILKKSVFYLMFIFYCLIPVFLNRKNINIEKSTNIYCDIFFCHIVQIPLMFFPPCCLCHCVICLKRRLQQLILFAAFSFLCKLIFMLFKSLSPFISYAQLRCGIPQGSVLRPPLNYNKCDPCKQVFCNTGDTPCKPQIPIALTNWTTT